MNYDDNNIFAKILRQEIPCIKVFEDESTLAFMDIMPQAEGHTLVIPKEHATDLLELSDAAAADLVIKVKLVATAVKKPCKLMASLFSSLTAKPLDKLCRTFISTFCPGQFWQPERMPVRQRTRLSGS